MSDDQIILMNEANQAATQNASTAVDWLARATPDDRPACKTRSRRPSRLHLRLTAGLETLCAVTWLGGPALRLPAAKALAAQDQQLRPWLTMASTVSLRPVKIDPRSPEHPYQQLARQLREQIETGKITSQLPSITDPTEQTGLAVGTVRRVINILVKEGLAQTVPGRGTFVRR